MNRPTVPRPLPRRNRRVARSLFVLVWLALTLAGCGQEAAVPDYVARVGDRYLTREELSAALESHPFLQDSTEAQQQIIEQWVNNELLYQEARRRKLRNDPDVRRLLEENERSVLISAYVNRLFEDEAVTPSPEALQTYFEQHRDQLRLREPFVRVRYLSNADADSAMAARRALLQINRTPNPDSAWTALVHRYADDPDGALGLSQSYFPESRLFTAQPAIQEELRGLSDGDVSPLIEYDGVYHVLQLVDRVPPGYVPELAWIENELKQRLTIEARKQMYARQVQRLRNEALARENLEIK